MTSTDIKIINTLPIGRQAYATLMGSPVPAEILWPVVAQSVIPYWQKNPKNPMPTRVQRETAMQRPRAGSMLMTKSTCRWEYLRTAIAAPSRTE